ncbi:hypothetical protein evm_004455 [Chilo suppressalis]|nr:hypothetical protein evm_004455 [Chilo suppressalis]
MDFIIDIIISNYNHNGWTNVITMGRLPDSFYKISENINATIIIANENYTDHEVDEILQHRANTIVMDCVDTDDFEKKFYILRKLPYYHPQSHIILYYHGELSKQMTAKIFFYFWYYMCPNVIIMTYNDSDEKFVITYFSPYIYENYKLDLEFGCRTRRKMSYPIENLNKSFICTEGCANVTSTSKTLHLGTCIGTRTFIIGYKDEALIRGINLFEEKGKNLHGYSLRSLSIQIIPFLMIDEKSDGTYVLRERDGRIWSTMAELMNFTIDLSPCAAFLKNPFNFELVIKLIFDFSMRKADLMLMPVYQFNFLVVEVDMTVPYKASGVCFMSHRAGFATTLFDFQLMYSNFELFIEAFFCFIGTWFVYFIFNVFEKGTISLDQVGKDFINSIRNVLCIPLYKPPKKENFRIFLAISIWSFFIINFATQAAIISFFSAYKRAKDVETFADIIEKGYVIEGVASPDVMLPEINEINNQINSRVVPVRDMFECVNKIGIDSRRFCLNDCSVGRYLQRNLLNDKGEQYLHIAKDQIHNHYLIMLLQKNSPLTAHYNKHMLRIIQAGLIDKWEEYRFHDITDEVPVKSLSMDDLLGVFKCYCLLVGLSVVIFVIEVVLGYGKSAKLTLKVKFLHWRRTRAAKKIDDMDRRLGTIKTVHGCTQTD